MPSRHSQHRHTKSFLTNNEKGKTGHGTQEVRFGRDSTLPFGHCALSLAPVEDPVATLSGHVYSRAAILEYILAKKRDLKRTQEAYDLQQARLQGEREGKERDAREAEIERFTRTEDRVVSSSAAASSSATSGGRAYVNGVPRGHGGAASELALAIIPPSAASSSSERIVSSVKVQRASVKRKAEVMDNLTFQADMRSHDEKREDMEKVSYWLPQTAPDHVVATIAEPPRRPPSPHSGQPLRAKDLITLHLDQDDEKKAGAGSDAISGRFICAVCKKELSAQAVVVIRTSGRVMMESCCSRFASDRLCPITGIPFKKKDVIRLVAGGSAFSSHNSVIAKRYRPALG